MPNRIADVFGKRRVFLPVIHPVDREGALVAVEVAVGAGADGIFTINQGLDEGGVVDLINEIYRRYPSLWVGVNLLSRSPADALAYALTGCGRIDGIWSDNAGVDERVTEQPSARRFIEARAKLGWNGLYFGGVAFKYQREVAPEALGLAAATAESYVDVVCTSGPGTGYAADPAKPRAMRDRSKVALALASGVTSANIGQYLPYVDAFLVGTGIERELGVLDPVETKRLAMAIHTYAP